MFEKTVKHDERFADPQADHDPRTADEGMTSIGASDLNSDQAKIPADVPGVRRGDADTLPVPRTAPAENSSLDGDLLDTTKQTGE